MPALAASTDAWSTRSIYQTMTDRFARTDGSTTYPCNTTDGLYCGGTWRGMINQLDYIEGMGFDAVMISPIIKNIEGRVSYGEAYHGYWPQDLYSLNPHFGTKQDLLDLSKALHDRGMYLMMDTVINNMAYITNGSDPSTSIDYSIFTPFNDPKYFHPYCPITDYNNYPLAQACWTGDNIVALPDLKTEDPTVQAILNTWIQEIMTNYSIDGLRLDAAKHVTPSFLPIFQKAATNSFITGEVYDQSVNTICDYQANYLPSVPNYPVYFALLDAFTRGNTSTLPNLIEAMKHACPNVTTLTSFSENHDVARFASLVPDMNLAKNLLTYTLLSDGIPMIYQGQEQHLNGAYDPLNREALWLTSYNTSTPLYQHIRTLNRLRKHIHQTDPSYLATQSVPVYRGSSEMAFRKGKATMLLSTQGTESGKYTVRLVNGYQPGVAVMEVVTCANYTVNERGEVWVDMERGEPRVLFPVEEMGGSGICGFDGRNGVRVDGVGSGGSRVGVVVDDGLMACWWWWYVLGMWLVSWVV
ncbi:alpha-amylase AmyA [Aspergillus sclerotiicarbonarius CBS 121057]|uniref:alpha-amylase n=1 Tax=Aspergillus sclerotiicarbonarius (strain CBS 121057 / IBT 28362) TaxID=1448318 RepID=A0A319DTM2_ASPSB|nr:alpha-amylase AmyA [Aspergillus sclerotiicarbonarius CBS 121057]